MKLEGALDRFDVVVAGRRAYDVGASTGGFTDCLLQRGAASVVAVDVGYGQLHERLRADPRVEVHERTNIRDVRPGDLGRAGGGAGRRPVVHLAPHGPSGVLPLAVHGADVVLLVKPQFEAGREEAARGKGRDHGPERVAARARGGHRRARGPGNHHHGGHGVTVDRCGRQRGVPAARRAPDPGERAPRCATLLDGALAEVGGA